MVTELGDFLIVVNAFLWTCWNRIIQRKCKSQLALSTTERQFGLLPPVAFWKNLLNLLAPE